MNHADADKLLTPMNVVGSTLGNALYSNLTLAEVWNCYLQANTLLEFDAAVDATAKLKGLLGDSRRT
jgi:hypothetical protein